MKRNILKRLSYWFRGGDWVTKWHLEGSDSSQIRTLAAKQASVLRWLIFVSLTHLFTESRLRSVFSYCKKSATITLFSSRISIPHQERREKGRVFGCDEHGLVLSLTNHSEAIVSRGQWDKRKAGLCVVLFSHVEKKVSWNLNGDTWPARLEWAVRWL